jgi:hypothetical protein
VNLAVAAPVAGRTCPADYIYSPAVFDRPPEIEAETLYVVGGLYGNLAALDTIERLAAGEATPPRIVFNGDFTCLAALREFSLPLGQLTIINNGAAGMPNFSASMFGVVTRIATTRSPHRTLYGRNRDGIHIDALAVHYDQTAFLNRFLVCWPEGTAAHRSYFSRINAGPDFPMAIAVA